MQETIREELNGSKVRYEKGVELYKQGKVSIKGDGLFKVSGFYEVDTGKMTCTCPDYKTRKETCKHLFASLLFTKNRGQQGIRHLDEGNCCNVTTIRNNNGNGIKSNPQSKSEPESKDALTKPIEGHSKDFNRQTTITRLATLNTAVEILKTHNKQISFDDVIALASQLETWALSK